MYLKSLEIQGFKSFPDKISLTFDKGLTAVVGPNGSGKSNIGDSVRWVLGEQSTKTLRGNKMEDVIFSGTVARKPMGFAAVTLNIDNSDGTLDGYDAEVAVTRKLYRSGESEYMINGKQVRLKDINELFMDTGLGRDGYSIIGQGRIAEIVGAKSSDRRDIFEEAAGISKFRYKKLEAERKLSSAEENIIRLNDIIFELESRVEPLRVQSQKAEKFIKLAEQRKRLEISVWVNKLNELGTKLEKLEEKLLVSKSEYENVENDIQAQEEKIQDGYRKMQESTVKSDELRRKMLEEEQSASALKADIAVFENDIRHSREAVEAAEKSLECSGNLKEKLNQALDAAAAELEKIKTERQELQEKISEITENFDKAEKQSAELRSTYEDAGSEISGLYIKQSEYKFTCDSSKASVEEESARLAEMKKSGSENAALLAKYAEDAESAEKRLRQASDNTEEMKNKLLGLEKLHKSRLETFEQLKAEFEKILYELREKQQRRKILGDLERNMDGFAGSVKQILRASSQGRISGICGTVAQNISVAPEYAIAVETALGGAMQNIIVENEDTAKRCIRFLKEQKGGRATFLPITSIKSRPLNERGLEECEGFIALADKIAICDEKYQGIISNLLGRTAIAEDIDSAAVIAKKYGYRFRIVTLDGQVVNAGGSFTGGSAQKSAGIITRKNEMETLDRSIIKLNTEKESFSEKAEKARAQAEKLRFDIEAAKEALTESESNKVRLTAELSGLKSLSGQVKAQAENSERLIAESEKKIAQANKNIAESEKALAEIEEKINSAEKELARNQDVREELRRQRESLSAELSQLRIKDMELGKNAEAKEAESERIRQDIADAEQAKKNTENEIAEKNAEIEAKQADIETVKQKLNELKENAEKYNDSIKNLQDSYNEYSKNVREMQLGLRQINEAKEKLSGEMTRLEERRDSSQKDYDNIIKQLLEVYELTRSEAVEIAEKIEDMTSAQRELNEIKNKIRALGSVNLEAIEEYREVSERYEFMSAQLADVNKSKSELEKIIGNLTEEMERIFSESFAIINSNFKAIFTELFGGGKAELILTDSENVLESGIEISVAPPGKVIKNLISLSGGEQSFVAIAIYFAILKLRPAPFCILDEIDAALDEVNVRKYAQYLKNFTDTTQFVLVTHRRSAMEEANVLYGVTMQEDGISKLLKMEQVDFQDEA